MEANMAEARTTKRSGADGRRTKVWGSIALVATGIAIAGLAIAPGALAKPHVPTWQLGFAGTGNLSGSGFGFWGWWSFDGNTSGSSGDCQVVHYLHLGGGNNLQCEAHFAITNWSTGTGAATALTGAPDFFVNAANLTIHPSTQTSNCAVLLAGEGYNVTVAGVGAITMVNTDLLLPATAGHYSYNGITVGPVASQELQIQVGQN